MSIGERIKLIRNKLNLTQIEFGSTIGVARNTIASYEGSHRNLTERTINDICREFNVEHLWLTTGEGDMFANIDEDDKLIELMNKALSNEVLSAEDKFIKDVLVSFAEFDTEHWKAFNVFMDKFMEAYIEVKDNDSKPK